MRDALTLLEQNTLDGQLLTQQVMATLSLLDENLIASIISAIHSCDNEKITTIIKNLKTQHIEVQ